MKKWIVSIMLTLLMLALFVTISTVTAQGPEPQGDLGIAAIVDSQISYQGVLQEDGTPVTGNRDMTFRFYSDDACTAQVESVAVPGVSVSNGLFAVSIPVTHATFDGQALWIGVEVDTTVIGCEAVLPVPYALSLRPGAEIQGAPTEWTGWVLNVTMENDYPAASAVYGSAATGFAVQGNSPGGRGIYGQTQDGYAVYGYDGGSLSARGYGGYFTSLNGIGVYGYSAANRSTYNQYAPGVYGSSSNGTGVYGVSQSSTTWMSGVRGESTEGYGVSGRSTNNYGLYGYSSNSAGVYGLTYATTVPAVHGHHGGDGPGVYGSGGGAYPAVEGLRTDGGIAVAGYASGGTGIVGSASATSGTNYGVRGISHSASGYGGYFVAETTGGVALYALNENNLGDIIVAANNSATPDVEFRVDSTGNVYADGTFTGGGADYADMLPVLGAESDYEPGDVLVIGPDGTMTKCSEAHDTAVVGVYSTDPAFIGDPRGASESDVSDPTDAQVPVALAGIVPVKVSAENGPIEPGDLLTTSSTPGHAMKATLISIQGIEIHAPGTVMGKALEPLSEGTGVIQMLVTLQ